MFVHFIKVLEEAGTPYCILAGYDGYPENIGSDIDFMVDAGWVDRLPALITLAATGSGAHLIQYLSHETTAAYYVLARLDGSTVSYLHPDSSADYRRRGRRWIEARRVLDNRRRHARGFWVPAAADAFAYYLIKKIDKGQTLQDEQARQLASRYAEDPTGCRRVLSQLLPEGEAMTIEKAARSGDWSGLVSLGRLKAALHARSPSERWPMLLGQRIDDMRRIVQRVAEPTGLHVVFLGPDGSGKSSVISRVCGEMGQAFRRVRYQHLRPGLLVRRHATASVTDPHSRPVRGVLGSTVKLVHFWLDYAIGSALWLLPLKVRSTLLVFDRYFHDVLADPKRYRYGGPMGLARWLGRLLPQPDLVFILDAPPSVLRQRKQEISLEESERQRGAYLALLEEFREARVIDVSQHLEKVVADILSHMIAYQQARVVRRLGVTVTGRRAVVDAVS
jgi:thymidylate kinase